MNYFGKLARDAIFGGLLALGVLGCGSAAEPGQVREKQHVPKTAENAYDSGKQPAGDHGKTGDAIPEGLLERLRPYHNELREAREKKDYEKVRSILEKIMIEATVYKEIEKAKKEAYETGVRDAEERVRKEIEKAVEEAYKKRIQEAEERIKSLQEENDRLNKTLDTILGKKKDQNQEKSE